MLTGASSIVVLSSFCAPYHHFFLSLNRTQFNCVVVAVVVVVFVVVVVEKSIWIENEAKERKKTANCLCL